MKNTRVVYLLFKWEIVVFVEEISSRVESQQSKRTGRIYEDSVPTVLRNLHAVKLLSIVSTVSAEVNDSTLLWNRSTRIFVLFMNYAFSRSAYGWRILSLNMVLSSCQDLFAFRLPRLDMAALSIGTFGNTRCHQSSDRAYSVKIKRRQQALDGERGEGNVRNRPRLSLEL